MIGPTTDEEDRVKVLRAFGVRDLRLLDEPTPDPGPGETLIEIRAVGICGSDLHWYEEAGIGDAVLDRPLVLGHELAGVARSGKFEGQPVCIDPAIPCGTCEWCRQGHPNLCPAVRFAGHGSQDGGLRQFMTWPEENLYRLADGMSFGEGVMLEPLGTALFASDLAHVRPGMTVGVFGCGPIGLLLVQLMNRLGALQVFATDRLEHRLEAALRLGATQVFVAEAGEERRRVLAATRQRGVDVAFEAAGDNEAVETAIATAKPGGTVALIGIPGDDRTSFQASAARRKGLTIKLVRRMKHTYPRAIAMVAAGLLELGSLVTHRFPLGEYEAAFQVAAQRKGIKVLIEPAE